jgi:hypothetical protein
LAADRAGSGPFPPSGRKTPAKAMSNDREVAGCLAALELALAPPSDPGKLEVRDLVQHLLKHEDELREFEQWCRQRAAQGGLI